MLKLLRITHLATIDSLEVAFDGGFNAITGETGAGKSILVDAVHLLLGGRAQADLVRSGFEECTVEGFFQPRELAAVQARLAESGLPPCEEGMLLVRRVVHREGRSRAQVNGAFVTAGQLAALTRGLVDVSSQHEQSGLLDRDHHLLLLDAHAGLDGKVADYRAAFDALGDAARRLRSLQVDEAERARRIDYLHFQLEEIDKVDPKADEEATLQSERQKLASAERLRSATSEAEGELYSRDDSVVERLSRSADAVEKAARFDPSLEPHVHTLRSALAQVEEAARDLGRYARGVDDDPRRLEDIDDRLEALKRLTRKHGGDLAAVLERRDAMRAELATLQDHATHLADAEDEVERRREVAQRLADGLTEERRAASRIFSEEIVARLAELDMKHTLFEPVIEPMLAEGEALRGARGGLGPRGQDVVEFHFSPNPGESPKPLAKTASGGELSRVMLAIKRVLARRDPVETYVFDEVDAGIGGATAETLGRMLHEVARDRQVLCITHLAQVAAFADVHFSVSKDVSDGRTHSRLNRLEGGDRERETARMLSGHLTEASLQHARELIARRGSSEGSRRKRRTG